MKVGILQWRPCHVSYLCPHPIPSITMTFPKRSLSVASCSSSSSTTEKQEEEELTGRERRQLRKERRERKLGYNWREEVEERFIKKTKKKVKASNEDLNLDNLADSGPQWWVVRTSRVKGHETAELIAKSLAKDYPDFEFKVYAPAVQEKRKLKNGTISVKPKPIFPGCVFLWCVLNKEIHDFVREVDGVGGFVGSRVGNNKRQINRPRPVSKEDMDAMFRQAKEEQEKFDRAFEEEQMKEEGRNLKLDMVKKGARKVSGSSRKDLKLLTPGSTLRVVSGTLAEYEGNLKKLNRKTGKVTVGFMIFGKESLVDLDINEIVVETK